MIFSVFAGDIIVSYRDPHGTITTDTTGPVYSRSGPSTGRVKTGPTTGQVNDKTKLLSTGRVDSKIGPIGPTVRTHTTQRQRTITGPVARRIRKAKRGGIITLTSLGLTVRWLKAARTGHLIPPRLPPCSPAQWPLVEVIEKTMVTLKVIGQGHIMLAKETQGLPRNMGMLIVLTRTGLDAMMYLNAFSPRKTLKF